MVPRRGRLSTGLVLSPVRGENAPLTTATTRSSNFYRDMEKKPTMFSKPVWREIMPEQAHHGHGVSGYE